MLLAIAFAVLLQGGTFNTVFDGVLWESRMRAADVDRSPRWAATDDAPPLPPRAAVRSARGLAGELWPGVQDWPVARVALEPVRSAADAWVYRVTFIEPLPAPKPNMPGSIISGQVDVIVLMDGTALRPVKRPLPRQ